MALAAARPRGRAPCPAALPGPTRLRARHPTRCAPPARPAWPCGRAAGTQAARAQQPGAPASSCPIEAQQYRRTSTASILVLKPQHVRLYQWPGPPRTDAVATLLRHRRRWPSQRRRRRRRWRESCAVRPSGLPGSGPARRRSPPTGGLRAPWGGEERNAQGRTTARRLWPGEGGRHLAPRPETRGVRGSGHNRESFTYY